VYIIVHGTHIPDGIAARGGDNRNAYNGTLKGKDTLMDVDMKRRVLTNCQLNEIG
jgi:hypothetical protein